MIQSTPTHDDEGKPIEPDPLLALDSDLQVSDWQVPGSNLRLVKRRDVPEGAPDWWKGESEASDSFLRAMGVKL